MKTLAATLALVLAIGAEAQQDAEPPAVDLHDLCAPDLAHVDEAFERDFGVPAFCSLPRENQRQQLNKVSAMIRGEFHPRCAYLTPREERKNRVCFPKAAGHRIFMRVDEVGVVAPNSRAEEIPRTIKVRYRPTGDFHDYRELDMRLRHRTFELGPGVSDSDTQRWRFQADNRVYWNVALRIDDTKYHFFVRDAGGQIELASGVEDPRVQSGDWWLNTWFNLSTSENSGGLDSLEAWMEVFVDRYLVDRVTP